jgi:hypothetical protein
MSQIVDFTRWRTLRLKSYEGGERIMCPLCDGHLEYEEECECCGEYSMKHCEQNHDEDGTVIPTGINEFQLCDKLSPTAYWAAVMIDAKALASWVGMSVVNVLVTNGFSPYCDIKSKRLYPGKQS